MTGASEATQGANTSLLELPSHVSVYGAGDTLGGNVLLPSEAFPRLCSFISDKPGSELVNRRLLKFFLDLEAEYAEPGKEVLP